MNYIIAYRLPAIVVAIVTLVIMLIVVVMVPTVLTVFRSPLTTPDTVPRSWAGAEDAAIVAIKQADRMEHFDMTHLFLMPCTDETFGKVRFIRYEVQCRPCRSMPSWPLCGPA